MKINIAIIMILAQLAVPAFMIYQRENTLRNGETFLFKTAPVDPFDAFRGRYVALEFDQESIEVDNADNFKRGSIVYLSLSKDDKGHAVLTAPQKVEPHDHDYIKSRVRYSYKSPITVDLPFDRFYMDEYSAPEAEKLYRSMNRRQQLNQNEAGRECYAKVKVLNGFAVLEDLIIDGKGIKQLLQEREN